MCGNWLYMYRDWGRGAACFFHQTACYDMKLCGAGLLGTNIIIIIMFIKVQNIISQHAQCTEHTSQIMVHLIYKMLRAVE